MKTLEPLKIYTNKEFRQYCKYKDIKMSSQLMKISNKGENYGMLIKVIHNNDEKKYQLYPELVTAF